MTYKKLKRLVSSQTTPEFQALPVNKKMTAVQMCDELRLTVGSVAYDLLLDCKKPKKAYDGHKHYMEEYWDISLEDLFAATDERLASKGWKWETGDALDTKIEYFCMLFLSSSEYYDAVEELRREHYENNF